MGLNITGIKCSEDEKNFHLSRRVSFDKYEKGDRPNMFFSGRDVLMHIESIGDLLEISNDGEKFIAKFETDVMTLYPIRDDMFTNVDLSFNKCFYPNLQVMSIISLLSRVEGLDELLLNLFSYELYLNNTSSVSNIDYDLSSNTLTINDTVINKTGKKVYINGSHVSGVSSVMDIVFSLIPTDLYLRYQVMYFLGFRSVEHLSICY